MTTLSYDAVTIDLPDDLLWSDEYAWSEVEIARSYSTTGALLVEVAAKNAGRPITLTGDESAAWVSRTVLEQLRTAAGIAGQEFTLVLNGVSHDVMFDAAPIAAKPLVEYSDPEGADFYVLTSLKFFKV